MTLFNICILSALFALTLCAPADQVTEPVIAIVAQNSDIQPDGAFQWSFESADGTKQEQSGSVKAGATPDETVASVEGSVAWVDPSGKVHELKYVADENGFQPQGDDVPVPPEVPAQIARALEWIAAHPQAEDTTAAQ